MICQFPLHQSREYARSHKSVSLSFALQHPHLPNRDEDDVTDKSEADTPTYDPNPELMTDEKLANRPKKPEKHKDGEAVSQDNTAMNNTGSGPKKQPEDIAPEQAGS